MPTNPLLRFRRSAAQLHALAEVERTIRATDTKGRRKYLRDFAYAFQSYRRVLKIPDLEKRLQATDIVLVGDYHALPASQHFTAALVEKLAASGKPVVLGVEAIVARDQHILDEWQQHEIDSEELRSRIRFETDWGYDWQPFRELLEQSRASGVKIFGLDCTPREDMRSIRARDRHAAIKIAELRREHPEATVVVLFGESHLAPTHLPALVEELRPADKMLTVLQNVDPLYWLSAGEPDDLVEAVEVDDDVICVFSATPLEKYEHYRLCIERWKLFRMERLDLAPSFYNLIGSLFQFLNVNPYATRRGEGRPFLVDEFPEVCSVSTGEQLDRLLARRFAARGNEVRKALAEQGSYFVADKNMIVAREFRMPWAAEQAARFVHQVCKGTPKACPPLVEDAFYTRVLETALAFLGSKVLCPSRKLYDEAQFVSEYTKTDHEIAELGLTKRAFHQVLDWIVLHKQYEKDRRHHHQPPPNLLVAAQLDLRQREVAVTLMGHLLGSELYSAYLQGHAGKRALKSAFFKKTGKPGSPRKTYFQIAEKSASASAQRKLRMVS
jgi:uncharacterized iron-regulated protein